jgi:hypothetical protein
MHAVSSHGAWLAPGQRDRHRMVTMPALRRCRAHERAAGAASSAGSVVSEFRAPGRRRSATRTPLRTVTFAAPGHRATHGESAQPGRLKLRPACQID